MGNILSKHSFDKKEEEFEKMWNENFESMWLRAPLRGYKRGYIFSKEKDQSYASFKAHVRKQWFSDQQMDDQDLDFSKYWSFLPTNDPCFQPEKTK